jgi:hypothetical protein
MTKEQSLVWASAHFLSTPFPADIFEYGDEDDILEHISEHPWQPFENHHPCDVYDYIDDLANDVRKLNPNQTKP